MGCKNFPNPFLICQKLNIGKYMAKLILSNISPTWTVPSGNDEVTVYGTTIQETINIVAGAKVKFAAFGAEDNIRIQGNINDYNVSLSGSTVILSHTNGNTISLGVSPSKTYIEFDEGITEVQIITGFENNSLNGVYLGGQKLVSNTMSEIFIGTNDDITEPTDDIVNPTQNPSTDDTLSGQDGIADTFVYEFNSQPTQNVQGALWAGNSGSDTIDNFEVGLDKLKLVDTAGIIDTIAEFTAGFSGNYNSSDLNYAAAMSGGKLILSFGPSEVTPSDAATTGMGQLVINGLASSSQITSGEDIINVLGGDAMVNVM